MASACVSAASCDKPCDPIEEADRRSPARCANASYIIGTVMLADCALE